MGGFLRSNCGNQPRAAAQSGFQTMEVSDKFPATLYVRLRTCMLFRSNSEAFARRTRRSSRSICLKLE